MTTPPKRFCTHHWLPAACLANLLCFAPVHAQSPANALPSESDRALLTKERPRPPVVSPQYDGQAVPPPAGALILFQGNSLEAWKQDKPDPVTASKDARWKVEEDYFEVVPKTGNLRTKEMLRGDGHLHLEWATPAEVKGSGQGRGNSGVFIGGFPEVQVLDSWENETYPDGQAAALYGKYPPLVNASKKPGEWQSYDIVVERARTGEDGSTQKQRITVWHNGVLVHDHVELEGKQREGTLALQDHGNPVRFRNIWFQPFPSTTREP
ncbi:MAG: hypothetical protein RLZZ399_2857 [Verrucomicrobiota bacterium]